MLQESTTLHVLLIENKYRSFHIQSARKSTLSVSLRLVIVLQPECQDAIEVSPW